MFFPQAILFIGSILTARTYGSPVIPRSAGAVEQRATQGFSIPLRRNVGLSKRGVSGTTGLGNNDDLLYTIPIELGGTATAVNIDTGSSDLWVISDQCTRGTCKSATVSKYPSSTLNSTGANFEIFYGDSTTGTRASGPIGRDVATVAGVAMTNQVFGATDTTNNSLVQYGAAGILGLGFPSASIIQQSVVQKEFGQSSTTNNLISSIGTDGPLVSRIAMTGALDMPIFSISLQRDTIDIGGTGLLTLGKLPDGVDNSSMTWVPVRLYSPADGGIQPPTSSPNEVYPLRWEIDIDAVYLDGQQLADSTIPALGGVDSTRVSALIDTGNSILRGPTDVVNNILTTVSPNYDPTKAKEPKVPCNVPHTLAFKIGGKMFPVDPRDFISPDKTGDSTTCLADNIVPTDPPSPSTLFRWSLGDPFFKSNLVAFHYGNLTNPSVDPPRVGIMSMVPADANQQLMDAVAQAQGNGGNFESTINLAPTASVATATQITLSNSNSGPTPTTNAPPAAITTLSLEGQPQPSPKSAASTLRRISFSYYSWVGVMLFVVL
ncbi:aspartic peptidase domain-containing protein [Infundibulicybe gibba]|nr:aspartic peptidase domain-containing protein [Infundibulicybe gibba]